MPPPRPEHTREALIARARAVARRRGTTRLTIGQFVAEAGVNPSRVYARFDDWPSLCAEAGLVPGETTEEIPTDTLLRALHDAVIAAGGIEPRKRLMKRVKWSTASYVRRFGDWGGALAALAEWAAANAPDFPHGPALAARIAAQARRRPYGGPPRVALPAAPPWPSIGGRPCGAPLAFRAMVHAPVNELGVVLLFGMVADDLGYAVDSVGAAFPDCAAKRLVAQGPRSADARWEPVRIEFEYRSRQFHYHGHDPAGCDVIVCWEHDWPDCPVEVLALKDAVVALAPRRTAGA